MRYFPLKLGIAFFSMIFGPLALRADEREKEKTNDAFESFAFIRNRLENEGTLILLKEPKYECVRRIENVALTAGERNFKWDELMKRRGVDDALIKGPSKVEWSVLSLRSIQGIKQNDTGKVINLVALDLLIQLNSLDLLDIKCQLEKFTPIGGEREIEVFHVRFRCRNSEKKIAIRHLNLNNGNIEVESHSTWSILAADEEEGKRLARALKTLAQSCGATAGKY